MIAVYFVRSPQLSLSMKTAFACLAIFLVALGAGCAPQQKIIHGATVSQQMTMQATINRAVQPCLNPNGASPAKTKLRLTMNRDGTLASPPLILGASNPAAASAVARAVGRCITPANPLKFDPALYEAWKSFNYVVTGSAL